jgi:hypothetical protein
VTGGFAIATPRGTIDAWQDRNAHARQILEAVWGGSKAAAIGPEDALGAVLVFQKAR